MKKIITAIGVTALLGLGLAATPAMANSGAELTQKNGCMACHGVDKKILGPGFKEVANKYKGNAQAVNLLVKKVKDGGSGVWGPVPMPPNAGKVNDADLKTMVEYILSLN